MSDPTRTLTPPTLDEVRSARERLRGIALRTPLLRLNVDTPSEIWLKCENLQPIGSFKLRGAANAMAQLPPETLARGVYTASAGNMAQGLAWSARRLGVPCSVLVPEQAPRVKVAAIERLGATVTKVPFDTWWRVMSDHGAEGMSGTFVHPFADPAVMAGNGTIALEILEDLPEPDAVLVPYGGGGLSTGIAATMRALKPDVRVYACEVATAAPLAASLAAGAPQTIKYTPSFVDGIGGKSVFPEIWPVVEKLLAGSLVVSLDETAAALRLMVERNRLVAEGAGAAPVAAALRGVPGAGRIVVIVSGGNIDAQKIAAILNQMLP